MFPLFHVGTYHFKPKFAKISQSQRRPLLGTRAFSSNCGDLLWEMFLVPTNPASSQLCAAPLSSLLSDYEDSAKYCEAGERRQVRLVGDCVRLGGAILSNHPGDGRQIFCLFFGMIFSSI